MLAKERMKGKAPRKAFEARMNGLKATAGVQTYTEPHFPAGWCRPDEPSPSAAKQQVAIAARKRESSAKHSAGKFRLTNYRKTLLRNGKLRLVVPDAEQLAQMRSAVSGLGKAVTLEKFNQMIKALEIPGVASVKSICKQALSKHRLIRAVEG